MFSKVSMRESLFSFLCRDAEARSNGRRIGLQGGEARIVGIVALDALEVFSWSEGVVPIAAQTAMHPDLPIAVRHAVALPAKLSRLVVRNFGAVVIQVDVAVRGIVTMEAVLIEAMPEHDVGMLVSERVDRRVVPVAVVAHRALISIAVAVKTQGTVHGAYGRGIEKTACDVAHIQGFAGIVLLEGTCGEDRR